jgi:arabinofuranosyltransferase
MPGSASSVADLLVRKDMPRTLRYLLIVFFVAVLTWAGRNVMLDDTLIYARYIRNALDGYGLVFNVGEHVNALTSPLYCYLVLGASKLLGGQVLLAMRVLFVLFLLGAAFLAEELAPYAGMIVTAYAFFYSVEGMETPLFMLLLALAALLYREKRWTWLPLVYGLLVLTRVEGGILAGLLFGLQVYRRHASPWRAWIAPALLLACYAALNLHWYGQLLPSSAGAKLSQGFSGYWGPWPTAFLSTFMLFRLEGVSASKAMEPLAVLAVVGIWLALRRRLTWAPPVIGFAVILFAVCLLLNIPSYAWYYAPFIFFGAIFTAVAIPRGRVWAAVVAASTILLCIFNAHTLQRIGPDPGYVQVDRWLQQNARPGSRIAAIETGLIGWQLKDFYIIDVIGLTTPPNAVHIAQHEPGRWIAEDRADYIVVHRPAAVWEAVTLNTPGYTRVPEDFGAVELYARAGLQH